MPEPINGSGVFICIKLQKKNAGTISSSIFFCIIESKLKEIWFEFALIWFEWIWIKFQINSIWFNSNLNFKFYDSIRTESNSNLTQFGPIRFVRNTKWRYAFSLIKSINLQNYYVNPQKLIKSRSINTFHTFPTTLNATC
jgi:hypothetical protein